MCTLTVSSLSNANATCGLIVKSSKRLRGKIYFLQ